MPITEGPRFGPYEIAARLGAGGMGEVYRARDTRLGREVALKILPFELGSDPARQARFEQEARAAAALNHPNITGLHDVGSDHGVSYIVTELVVGETLEAVIARGKPADSRSDQFSFGLILYEMAAGRRAFDKPESVQPMAAILAEDPPPIDRSIPAPLRWAIDRCLAKEPADRYESTRDLYQELRHLRDRLSDISIAQAPAAAIAASRPHRRKRWL